MAGSAPLHCPTAPPTRLWLVRHAEPVVPKGVCYGALDVPADAAATQVAARGLAEVLPPGARVLHSPLQRCEHLALDLQGLRPDLTPQPDPRLCEMDFGRWEGQRWDDLARSEIDAWVAEFAHHAPGGGEPLTAVLARVASALRDVLAGDLPGRSPRRDENPPAARDVVWITHAGVIRSVAWLQAHGLDTLPTASQWPVPAPAWGEWVVVER